MIKPRIDVDLTDAILEKMRYFHSSKCCKIGDILSTQDELTHHKWENPQEYDSADYVFRRDYAGRKARRGR